MVDRGVPSECSHYLLSPYTPYTSAQAYNHTYIPLTISTPDTLPPTPTKQI